MRKSRGASDHWFLAITYELNEPPKTGRKSAEGVPLLKNIDWQPPTENRYTIITLYQLAVSSTSKKPIFSTSLFQESQVDFISSLSQKYQTLNLSPTYTYIRLVTFSSFLQNQFHVTLPLPKKNVIFGQICNVCSHLVHITIMSRETQQFHRKLIAKDHTLPCVRYRSMNQILPNLFLGE